MKINPIFKAALCGTLLLGQIKPGATEHQFGIDVPTWTFGLNQARAECNDSNVECVDVKGEPLEDPNITPIDGGGGGTGGTSTGGNGSDGGGSAGGTPDSDDSDESDDADDPPPEEQTEEAAEEEESPELKQCKALAQSDWNECRDDAQDVQSMSKSWCGSSLSPGFFDCQERVDQIFKQDLSQCTSIHNEQVQQCSVP